MALSLDYIFVLSLFGRTVSRIGRGFTRHCDNLCQKEDGYTAAHSSRIAKIAHAIGSALGLSECDMDALNEASELHDIGKIRVSLQVLNKPGKLTDEEFEEMKKHSAYGFAIVSPEDAEIADIILSHHERYDGSGYPNRLSGKDIPYLARIIAVADSIDAMSSDRCYRKALPWSVCVDEIIKNRGKMYDPDVVSAFDTYKHEIMEMLTRL